ncbi:MAG: DUF6152 family protein [Opitutales bacterium]|nr:DUF6152 family protein [Opitutales bacterium]
MLNELSKFQNMTATKRILFFFVTLAASGSLHAHHSSSPHFDLNKEVTVSGVVTRIRLVNPHAYLYFDVTKNGKTENWRCELSSGTQLRRRGWTPELFPKGAKITVSGAPARREDNHCYLNSLTFEDGTVIERRTDLTSTGGRRGRAPNRNSSGDYLTHLENGQPNLQGAWVSLSFGRRGMGQRARFRATPEGSKAAEGYEMQFDDPILRCHIVNVLNGWNHDRHVNEITQTDTTITMQYGFMDFVRTIHLDQDEHPENIEPSTGGHSIGHWEGDTLVVDTIGFEAGVLNHMRGAKHSDQMHVIERFYFDEQNQHLVREYTVSDPLYLLGETRGSDMMAISDIPYTPYNCEELSGKNNIRPSEQ